MISLLLRAKDILNFIVKNHLIPRLALSKGRKRFMLFLALSYYLYSKYMHDKKVKIVTVGKGLNQRITEVLKKGIKEYSPTFYLFSPYIKIYLNVGGERHTRIYYRKIVQMKDGEEIALDIYPKRVFWSEYQKQQPFIIYVPGLTGDSRERQTRIFAQEMHQKYRFNVAIYNRRGYSGMPFKKQRFITWSNFEDFEEIIDFVNDKLKASQVYLAGLSMGANFILNYAGHKGSKNEAVRAQAMFCISSPYNLKKVTKLANSSLITRNAMTNCLVQTFTEHEHEEVFLKAMKDKGIDRETVINSKNTDEFNTAFCVNFGGYKDLLDYKFKVSSDRHICQVQIPTFCLNSLDDPLIGLNAIPFEKIKKNPYITLITVNGGGHTEYFTGIKMKMWAFDLAAEYFHLHSLHHTTKSLSISPSETNQGRKHSSILSPMILSK